MLRGDDHNHVVKHENLKELKTIDDSGSKTVRNIGKVKNSARFQKQGTLTARGSSAKVNLPGKLPAFTKEKLSLNTSGADEQIQGANSLLKMKTVRIKSSIFD